MTLASKISLSFVLALLACLPAASVRAGITYQMVTVGNAGNASDTTGYGAVAYSYQIGTYDVTIGNYAAFLNAVDGSGTNAYGLYNSNMRTDLNVAGISYASGAAAGSKYSVMNNGGGSASRPITYVSWFDAARFANWMSNGQGSSGTETGAYTLGGATSGNAVAANPGAAFTIPTENEWYKAAFYSPSKGGTSAPGYYLYAAQSDSIPGNNVESPSNQANYNNGVYSVTGLSGYTASQNYLTDVGVFSGSASFYGTFDQSGNVFQWNDLNNSAGALRGSRGEDWGGRPPTTYRARAAMKSPPPSRLGASASASPVRSLCRNHRQPPWCWRHLSVAAVGCGESVRTEAVARPAPGKSLSPSRQLVTFSVFTPSQPIATELNS